MWWSKLAAKPGELFSNLLPKLLKGIEIPKLLAHEMDYDVSAVYELPAIVPNGLMAVVHFKPKFVQKPPKLTCKAPEVSKACDGAYYKALGPGALLGHVYCCDFKALVVNEEFAYGCSLLSKSISSKNLAQPLGEVPLGEVQIFVVEKPPCIVVDGTGAFVFKCIQDFGHILSAKPVHII